MHDDKSWLKHPILPRPPAVPHFGPELRALIGLDAAELEGDAASADRSARPTDADELTPFAEGPVSTRPTRLEALEPAPRRPL